MQTDGADRMAVFLALDRWRCDGELMQRMQGETAMVEESVGRGRKEKMGWVDGKKPRYARKTGRIWGADKRDEKEGKTRRNTGFTR